LKKHEIFIIILSLIFLSCDGEERVDNRPEFSEAKERDIRTYNIEVAKNLSKNRSVCDTLALEEFIIDTYPAGTYLIKFNKTSVYNVPKKAVIYYKDKCNKNQYIFACIVKSKECERFVEPNNIIGYDASFINFDSTKLGTALFYLTLFECNKNNSFRLVWEKIVPSQGGFNSMRLKKWRIKNALYVEMNFNDGIISGHRNYNYFIQDSIENEPHLLETYDGIGHKRTLANNDDNIFPDYYEYRFIHDSTSIGVRDSIPFFWENKKQLYVTAVNKNWYREY